MKMKVVSKVLSVVLSLSLFQFNAYAEEKPFSVLESSVLPRLLRISELCRENGIDTSYEDININVISDYIEYGKEIYTIDENKGEYVKRSLEKIAADTENALISYLKGEGTNKEAVTFSGGKVEIDGYSMRGNTNKGERPVFFIGYNNGREYIDEITEYGANLIQMEMGPSMYIVKAENTDWNVSGNAADYNIIGTDSHSGDKCLEISNVSGDFTLYQDMSLSSGSYTVTYYVKGSGVSGGEVQLGTRTKSLSGVSDTWTKNTLSVYISSSQTVRFSVKVKSGTKKLLIDNITVKKSSVDYIKNGNFENEFQNVVTKEESKIGVAYSESTEYYDKYIAPAFDKADKQGIKVDFIISPHYFPEFVKTANNIGVKWTKSDFNSFLKYDIYSEEAKETIREYLEFIVPAIKDRSSLLSICLTNEPKFQIAYIDGFFDKHPEIHQKWIQYLKGKYKDINELNSVYGKSYTDFSDVELSLESRNVQYYDSMVFNAEMLSEWHMWLADIVKEYAPDIPVHTKQMYSMSYGDGMHAELAANGGYAELGGYDYHNVYTTRKSLHAGFAFNDFIASVSKTPTFNSETHVIYDTNEGYSHYREETGMYMEGFLWQGAIHGRTATAIWAIEKSLDKNHIFYDSFGTRPESVAAAGKTLMDLNRLSPVVSEFQNAKADVGILYCDASAVYNTSYSSDLSALYGKINNSGQKVEFVTENGIKNGSDLKIIVVPKQTAYVREETIKALNEYVKNGGCLIAYDGFCSYNEKKQPNTAVPADGAVILSENEDIYARYLEKVAELNLDDVVIFENSSRAANIDYRSVVINGKRYVNLCNEKDTERKISLTVDGGTPQFATDLISGKSINPSEFTIKPYKPMLLEITDSTEDAVTGLSANPGTDGCVFSWNNNTDESKVFTLYDDDGKVICMKVKSPDETDETVSGLEEGTDYKAVLSCSGNEYILNFRTKVNVVTRDFIKGWGLDYRGLNLYEFNEGEYKIVSDEAYEGQSSLKFRLYNPWQDMCYFQLWKDVRLTAGKTYKYSLKYKTEDYYDFNGTGASFTISANGRNEEITVPVSESEGEWHEYSFEYKPKSSKNYSLSIIISRGGTIWIDDISICPVTFGVTGENLLKETSSSVGGGFESELYRTVPELSGDISADFYGMNELKFNIPDSDDFEKINVYRDQNGEKVRIVSANPDEVSVSETAFSDWNYYISAVDGNGNESPMISLGGKSLGNISKPFFFYGTEKAEYLTEGNLGVMGYAYDEAELWLAVYNDGKLEAVRSDSGTGWLKAEYYISGENTENKTASVFFWSNVSPMNYKNELYPMANN